MDSSAAEKIKEAELLAKKALEGGLGGLEKNLADEEKKCGGELEAFTASLKEESAKSLEKSRQSSEKELSEIRKKGEKALKDTGILSKKNMGAASLAFVRVAGSVDVGK